MFVKVILIRKFSPEFSFGNGLFQINTAINSLSVHLGCSRSHISEGLRSVQQQDNRKH